MDVAHAIAVVGLAQESSRGGSRTIVHKVLVYILMVPTAKQLALFEQGQPLVRSLALTIRRRLPVRMELDDLIGYGQLGLAEAVKHFDDSKRTRFTTFAYYRIKGAIYDGVSKMSWTSRGRLNRLRFQQTGRQTGEAAPAGSDKQNRLIDQLARVHLTDRYDPEASTGIDAGLRDAGVSPLTVAMNREAASKLEELVKALPRVPRVLIESVYYEGVTLREAAVRLGISKSWASRLHAQTLQRLAVSLRKWWAE